MKLIFYILILFFIPMIVNGQDCLSAPIGWSVRVCLSETEADHIDFEVGVGGDVKTHRYWFRWTKDNNPNITFPIDLVYAKEIWFKATSHDKKNVSLCIFFNGHVTQAMQFDNFEKHETSRDDDDTDNCECK